MDRRKVCCFTGHRNIPASEIPKITAKLDEVISELAQQGVNYFGSGGARGFDHLAALSVIRQREINQSIKLIMVLPCHNQDKYWNEFDKKVYCNLLECADKLVYTSENYYNGCMEKRNRHLVENSGICVSYMTKNKSGTEQTMRLAREQGLIVINLA